jgi:hypothetical protein
MRMRDGEAGPQQRRAVAKGVSERRPALIGRRGSKNGGGDGGGWAPADALGSMSCCMRQRKLPCTGRARTIACAGACSCSCPVHGRRSAELRSAKLARTSAQPSATAARKHLTLAWQPPRGITGIALTVALRALPHGFQSHTYLTLARVEGRVAGMTTSGRGNRQVMEATPFALARG